MRARIRGGLELDQRLAFLRLLEPGWVCCDVGAQVGDYTVEMARRIGAEGLVYAYEPFPHYFDRLEKTVTANQLTNVICGRAVVGSESGGLLVPRDMLTGSLMDPARSVAAGEPNCVRTPIVQLDEEVPRLHAAKIDCEGYEFDVIQGMDGLLSRGDRILLFVEIHERQLTVLGRPPQERGELLLDRHSLVAYQLGRKHCLATSEPLDALNGQRVQGPHDFAVRFRGT